jgi:hypothetical protein
MTPSEYVLLGVAGVSLAGLCLMVWARRRARLRDDIPVVDWEARAEAAERRAEQAEATVKAGLLPHLARLLRSKLVSGLIFQRRRLVESHQQGAERAEALEGRLASVQKGIEAKLHKYEGRLRELSQPAEAPQDDGAVRTTFPRAPEPPRRNPLLQRPVGSQPAPVKFAELISRKKAAGSPTASSESDTPKQ